jgi:hypothetical protein
MILDNKLTGPYQNNTLFPQAIASVFNFYRAKLNPGLILSREFKDPIQRVPAERVPVERVTVERVTCLNEYLLERVLVERVLTERVLAERVNK